MELHQLIKPYYLNVNPSPEGVDRVRDRDRDRDRFPQWTHAETKEFLGIRAELDPSFMETKRNKPLWQAISARLEQKGFNRTPEQCKSKWKNLVTRFKVSSVITFLFLFFLYGTLFFFLFLIYGFVLSRGARPRKGRAAGSSPSTRRCGRYSRKGWRGCWL